MRRLLAFLAFGVGLAAAAAWSGPQAFAQQPDEAELQRKAEAFVRLWEALPQTQEPSERIAGSEQAIKLANELGSWPLPVARDEALVRLWRWTGQGYAEWMGGDREEKLERAIGAYQQAAQIFTRERVPDEWARTQDALGEVYRQRIRGNRAENLEKAIAIHEAAVTVLTREAFAQDWAITTTNLGAAYSLRLRGDRAENLDKAIGLFEAALTVHTREAFPQEWALTQANRAGAYLLRVRGDRAENLEKAITLYEEALTVPTREAFPQDWALAQANLGVAYLDRLRGDRGESLEKAIAAFREALTVRTREASPQEWAWTQHYLGQAYENRIRGIRADNLEKAIELCKAALTVRTREAYPQEWATTQHNLANLHIGRIEGDRADNVEQAIEHLEAALSVRSAAEQPREWAGTKQKLGWAFVLRARGERADNIEKAIAAFEEAVPVLGPQSYPGEWGDLQSSLAILYSERIRGQRAENMEKAIDHLHTALKVVTRDAQPEQWAMAQLSLGHAYARRVAGNAAENRDRSVEHIEAALTVIKREADPQRWGVAKMMLGNARLSKAGGDLRAAMDHYEAALTVMTREAFPLEWSVLQGHLGRAYLDSTHGERGAILAKAIGHLETALEIQSKTLPRERLVHLRALGAALSEKGEWQRAAAAYADARETFLLLSAQGLDDTAAGNLINDAGPLFSEAAYAAAQLGETEKALALASEGRARLLTAALKLQALDLPADERRRLDALQAEIRSAERTVEAPTTQGADRTAAVERLVSLRQELLGLVKGADAAETKVRGSTLAQVRALAGKDGAVVVPIVTKLGGRLLVVESGPAGLTPGRKGAGAKESEPQGLTAIELPELTTAALDMLVRGVGPTDGWLGAYQINTITDDSELDRRWPEWTAAIYGLGPDLWRLLGARIDAALTQVGVKAGARIVWLPPGALGILPLGLAQNPANKRRLLDSYEIVYAPSLDALVSVQGQIAKATPATLAVVVNPTGDLPAAEQEGRLVASLFPAKARAVLEGPAATPETVLDALKGRSYWHFATHGTFTWRDPRQSGLFMHGLQRLSVGQLLETGGLGRPRLVVLSACETGLHDISRNPDEFIGLPGAFMALGAAGVLGTLWPVNDMATALLVSKFYDLHLVARLAPPAALRQAQLWLRQATNADLVGYAKGAARQGRLGTKQVAAIAEELGAESLRRARNRALVEWIAPAAPGARKPASPDLSGLARPYTHPYYWAGFIYTGL